MIWLVGLTFLVVMVLITVIVVTGGKVGSIFTAPGETFARLKQNGWPLLLTLFTMVSVLLFLYTFYGPNVFPLYAGPKQPIAFSHRLHAGVKNIQCEFCHSYVARSIHPGLPPVEKCLYCHNHIIANHPEIQKEHDYYNSETPIPWKKVYYLAEHVLFNHERHIKKNIECKACHGAVEEMDRLKGERFKMGFCVQCHEKNNANLACWLACHM